MRMTCRTPGLPEFKLMVPNAVYNVLRQVPDRKKRYKTLQAASESHESNAHIYGYVSVCRGDLAMAQVL